MQRAHRFHPQLQRASVPTYGASYLFPLLLVVCEVYRVGCWIALNGADFTGFRQTRHEYALMLGMFAVQTVAEAAFLGIAWMSRHAGLEHRLTDVAFSLVCSFLVLAFDYGLQIAF